jgi:anti-sigma factor RsiW
MAMSREGADSMTIGEHTPVELVCQDLVELLTDYLEGSCDVATVQSLEAHLEECPDCREYVAQMKATIDQVGYVPLETLSPATQKSLVAAFRDFRQAARPTSP